MYTSAWRVVLVCAFVPFLSVPRTIRGDGAPSGPWRPGESAAPARDDEPVDGTFAAEGLDVPLGGTREPAVAINPSNNQNVAMSSLFASRVSTNGGATWTGASANVVLAGYGQDGDPSLAFGGGGRLFYSYQGFHGASGGADEFVSELNPVTGARIRGPFKVTTSGSSGNYNDKDWLAVDRFPTSPLFGRMYLVWTEFSSSTRVRSSFSTDFGATWSAPLILSQGADGFPWPAHIAVAPNGDVYVAYHAQPSFFCNPDGATGRIVILRSTDGGVTFPQRRDAFPSGAADITFNVQNCGDGVIPGVQFWLQGSTQPWILPDPHVAGSVYVVANDDPDNNHDFGDDADVFIARSADHGLTWGAPIRVDDGPGTTLQVMPSAAIDDSSGCMAVLWYDNRAAAVNGSGRYLLDVRYAISSDKGLTFAPSVQLNDAAFDPDRGAPSRFPGPPPTTRIGEYVGVAFSDGILHAVWTGNTASAQQIITDSSIDLCDPIVPPSVTAEPAGTSKNRYVSVVPPTADFGPTALAVELTAMPPAFSAFDGERRYVGPPANCQEGATPTPTFRCATLQCAPHYQNWGSVGLLHVTGAEVVPGASYAVESIHWSCADHESSCNSASIGLPVSTRKWGDVVDPSGPTDPTFLDISAIVDKFKGTPTAIIKARAQLQPNIPDPTVPINFLDVSTAVGAFRGNAYPFAGPDACP